MSKEKITLKVGYIVFLRSYTKKKHPLTVKELDEDEDINDWDILCVGITSKGKAEHHRFSSPNMIKKKKKKKKKKKTSYFPDVIIKRNTQNNILE